jgi:hypothetical protein
MLKIKLRKRLPVFKGFCKDCDNIADWEPYTYCGYWDSNAEPNGWCYKWEKKRVENVLK